MRYLLLLLTTIILFSCGGNNKPAVKKTEVVADTVSEEPADLVQALAADTTTKRNKDQKENYVKIVKKYGEQWDFCRCVVVSDSINKAFKNKLTEAQMDALIERFDLVDRKCKELTTFDNTTPDDRAKHEKKVKKCLKAAGVRV